MDGDGDPDLVIAYTDAPDAIFENLPGGYLVPMRETGIEAMDGDCVGIVAEDFDADGDVDLYFVGEETDRYYLNDGFGLFSVTTSPATTPDPERVQPIDWNEDGTMDIFVAGDPLSQLLLAQDGRLVATSIPAMPVPAPNMPLGWPSWRTCAIDLGGDGAWDIVGIDSSSNGGIKIARNDGTARFTSTLVSLTSPNKLAAVDLNDDGLEDLYMMDDTGDRMMLSDAAGNLTSIERTAFVGISPRADRVMPGDFDGDGDFDLLIYQDDPATGTRRLELLIQDDQHKFSSESETRMPVAGSGSLSKPGDFDGDGDLDVIGAYSGTPEFLENDGSGFFTRSQVNRFPGSLSGIGKLVPLDYDGDGDLDLILADYPTSFLWLNDGTGKFSVGTLPEGTPWVGAAAAGDVDADGDQDVWLFYDLRSFWLIRDPAGDRLWEMLDHESSTYGVADFWQDFDGDGDLDFVSHTGWDFALWVNRTRQCFAPRPALPGAEYQVRVDFRPGQQLGPRTVGVALGLQRAATPWPGVGEVGIRLDDAQIFGIEALPSGAGTVTMSQTLPAWPSLIGMEFYLQALIFKSGPFEAELTNVFTDWVR